MEDELTNDSEIESEVEKKPRMDQRVEKALSEKTKAEELAAKESKGREKAEKEAEVAKKDLEFFKSFNTISSKYAGASEYQDQIQERVNKGYDLEEAVVAVLNKEGKFTPPAPAPLPKESPAGGSSATQVSKSNKSIAEMTQEERREILKEHLGLNL